MEAIINFRGHDIEVHYVNHSGAPERRYFEGGHGNPEIPACLEITKVIFNNVNIFDFLEVETLEEIEQILEQ